MAGVGCNCTASNFKLLGLAEVESRAQGSRQRPRTQKRPEAKDRPFENGLSRGQGHNAQVFSKKKVIAQKKIANFPRISGVLPKKRSSEIFLKVSGLLQQDEKKTVMTLAHF